MNDRAQRLRQYFEDRLPADQQPWVEWETEVPSTMDRARERANTQPGVRGVFLADLQTAGRGTQGRQWKAAEGALSVTLVLPVSNKPVVTAATLVVGLAVTRSLDPHGASLALKWPNDIVSKSGEKIGGILCEQTGQHFLIGIGINLADSPALQGRSSSSISKAMGVQISPEQAARTIALCLFEIWPQVEQSGFVLFQQQWLDRAFGRQSYWKVDQSGRMREGTMLGIGSAGELLLQSSEEVLQITSGHILEIRAQHGR